jgi:hypothetical protein
MNLTLKVYTPLIFSTPIIILWFICIKIGVLTQYHIYYLFDIYNKIKFLIINDL